MRARAGDRIPLRAAELDLEGRGVAHLDELEVHAAGLLPGEEADVVIEQVSRHAPHAFGRVDGALRVRSPDRVEPPCPRDRCGGCAWQPLAYAAQLEHKRRRVERALGGLVTGGVEVAAVTPAPAQLGYRNKATYVLASRGGRIALGAYAPRSHEWVDTSGCRVVHPAIAAALEPIGGALTASGLALHDEKARTGHLRYAVVRASRAGDALVGLVTTSGAPRAALDAMASRLIEADGVRGVVWLPNDATSGAILGREAHLLAGAATLAESIDGIAIEVAIDTFLQVNLGPAEALYRRLVERVAPHAGGPTSSGWSSRPTASDGRPGMAAVDVYCGIGPIALLLARAGADLLGIERNPASVAAARAAAERGGVVSARFEVAAAAELPGLLAARAVDVVVVNPPRQGLDAAVRAALVARPPAMLVYVSCGPDSLGRDLAELAAAGLRVQSIEPFDLMPGTGHVETLVTCRR